MKYFLVLLSVIFLGCEKPSDCTKSTGKIVSKTIDFSATPFDKILVYKGISLVIKQGNDYKVAVSTGENLINDIQATVVGNKLTLQDNTTCNWVRDYGQTIVTITTPNLTEIYSKTEQNITSNGVLTFPSLRLVALDKYDGLKDSATGDFILQIDNASLTLENNYISNFIITGQTQNLNINVYEGNGVIDTRNLVSKKIEVYHRGSNKVFVNPVEEITGDIYNIGDVFCVSRPAIQTVIAHYRGRFVFL